MSNKSNIGLGLMVAFKQKIKIVLMGFWGLILLFGGRGAVAAESDMDILLMYYEEKDLVLSSTRHLKPVAETPENITVIYKEDISAMNAHTVGEVLNRVTGLFVYFHTLDFGSLAQAEIHGAYARQVLVMVDGFVWGKVFSGYLKLLPIPVRIIERIEIIKGPASSVWGSSLGGVINIITQSSRALDGTTGAITSSYGEEKRQDYGVELKGGNGTVGYYGYGGSQYQEASLTRNPYESLNLFSKINMAVSETMDMEMSAGYNRPEAPLGDPVQILNDMYYRYTQDEKLSSVPADLSADILMENRFVTASVSHRPNRRLEMGISMNYFDQENDIPVTPGSGETRVVDFSLRERSMSVLFSTVFKPQHQTVVMGVDYTHDQLDQAYETELAFMGPSFKNDIYSEKWAIYANDTVLFDPFSVTSGIRFDQDDQNGSFISPSLGFAYSLSHALSIKASIARGFTSVPLSFTISPSEIHSEDHPHLESETIWAYQAGFAYDPVKVAWLKANLFYYDMDNTFSIDENGSLINTKGTWCYGAELDIRTRPLYRISLFTGGAYVFRDTLNRSGATERYRFNAGVRYDDERSVSVDLFGYFIEWGRFVLQSGKEDDMIWDLCMNKKYSAFHQKEGKVFLKVHNLFNGSQYTLSEKENPRRWVEAGMEVPF